jgi:hypothetical protein
MFAMIHVEERIINLYHGDIPDLDRQVAESSRDGLIVA